MTFSKLWSGCRVLSYIKRGIGNHLFLHEQDEIETAIGHRYTITGLTDGGVMVSSPGCNLGEVKADTLETYFKSGYWRLDMSWLR